jgi:hypothetical protein
MSGTPDRNGRAGHLPSAGMLIPQYAADLRRVIALDMEPGPLPNVLPAGGSLTSRLADLSRTADDGDVRVLYEAGQRVGGTKSQDGSTIRYTTFQRYALLRVGHSTNLLGTLLSLSNLSSSSVETQRRCEAALWRVYANRYEFAPLPPYLLALLRSEPGESDAALIEEVERVRRTLIDPNRSIEDAQKAWAAARARLLVPATRPWLTDRQVAVAELFADVMLCQGAALHDVLRARAEQGQSESLSDVVRRMDEEQTFELESTLSLIVKQDTVLAAVPEESLASVRSDLSRSRMAARPKNLLSQPETPPDTPAATAANVPSCVITPPTAHRPSPRRVPASVQPPRPWEADAPPLVIPEWAPFGADMLEMADACRHILCLGGSGGGKTMSAILPLLRATANYAGPERPDLSPAMLVIDPKLELAPVLEDIAAARGERSRIRHFAGGDGPLLHLFGMVDPLTMEPRDIVRRLLAPSTAYQAERFRSRTAFFCQAAERFLACTIGLDLSLYSAGGIPWIRAFWDAVHSSLRQKNAPEALRYQSDRYADHHRSVYRLSAVAPDAIIDALRSASEAFGIEAESSIASLRDLPSETRESVIATIENILSDVASREVSKSVWLNPFEPPPADRALEPHVSLDDGHWIIYTPETASSASDYVGRALKTCVFEAVLRRSRTERPIAYIADEFQRFVTGDAGGEQGFLDRCRAYRCSVVLATQSLSSLQFALAAEETPGGNDATTDVLVANTATRLIFRTTDAATRRWLEEVIPEPPIEGRRHVVRVRPPSTLSAGEAYVVRSDGSWVRGRARL